MNDHDKRKRGCRGGRGKQHRNTSATVSPQLSSSDDLKSAQNRASLWQAAKEKAEQKAEQKAAAHKAAQDFRNKFFGACLPKPSKTPNTSSAQSKPR